MSSTRSCSPFSVRALTFWVVQIVLAIVGVTRGSECAPFNATINGYDCEALSTSFNFSNATLASNTTYLWVVPLDCPSQVSILTQKCSLRSPCPGTSTGTTFRRLRHKCSSRRLSQSCTYRWLKQLRAGCPAHLAHFDLSCPDAVLIFSCWPILYTGAWSTMR